MKLYEIKERYIKLMDMIEDGSIPEDAIADTLESIEGEFEDKVDNIASLIKSLNAEAGAIYEEEKRLEERRKRKEKNIDSLKSYLSATMLQLGKSKFESSKNVLSFRKSTSVWIPDEETFKTKHPDLCKTETVVKISKSDISELLKAGQEVDGAQLVEKQNLQVK